MPSSPAKGPTLANPTTPIFDHIAGLCCSNSDRWVVVPLTILPGESPRNKRSNLLVALSATRGVPVTTVLHAERMWVRSTAHYHDNSAHCETPDHGVELHDRLPSACRTRGANAERLNSLAAAIRENPTTWYRVPYTVCPGDGPTRHRIEIVDLMRKRGLAIRTRRDAESLHVMFGREIGAASK